jgi:CBS domain containing-hemolysin-like protein
MNPVDIVYLVLLIVLVFLSALYSASDMAYSSVNKLRLEKYSLLGDKKCTAAYKAASNYDETIATILFGNDFVNILASSLASLLGTDLLAKQLGEDTATTLTSIILVVILLIFGEIAPKAIAKEHSYSLSIHLLPFYKVSSIIFYPFTKPANWLAKQMARPFIEKVPHETSLASDEELEAMVDDIEEEGVIDEGQSELLHKTIDFKETSCYEIMTPRVNVFAYDIDTPLIDFIKNPESIKFSRIPVYRGDLDHVLGYFQLKTLLRVLVKGGHPSIEELIMPIVSVPRTMEISSTMALMKETHHHIAIVRDEYGGMEGLITLEDILEELVGEMWDESDSIKDDVTSTPKKNVFIVKGSMNIDDFFERFNLNEKKIDEDYNTLSGWINDKLGRFAEIGDRFSFGKIDLKVLSLNEYSIKEVEISYHPRRKKNYE